MTDECCEQLRAMAAAYLSEVRGCHRFDHTMRVVETARRLAAAYPEVRRDLLEAAAWLHDIGRAREAEDRRSHACISAELAADLLPPLAFTPQEVTVICEAIADHRFSEGRLPRSLEGRVLQDADRLDALGAIGIARTCVQGAERAIYHPDDPFARRRIPDDDAYTIDHFFTKLLRVPDTLHTPEARALAAPRVACMRTFLAHLAEELAAPAEITPV